MLARRGAGVAVAGRTPEELVEVADAIGRAGGTAITVTCDVSDEDSVRSAIATTMQTWGRLDVVVANAGVNGTWAGIDSPPWRISVRLSISIWWAPSPRSSTRFRIFDAEAAQ